MYSYFSDKEIENFLVWACFICIDFQIVHAILFTFGGKMKRNFLKFRQIIEWIQKCNGAHFVTLWWCFTFTTIVNNFTIFILTKFPKNNTYIYISLFLRICSVTPSLGICSFHIGHVGAVVGECNQRLSRQIRKFALKSIWSLFISNIKCIHVKLELNFSIKV